MPHLAPLKWFILMIIFWSLLIMSMTMSWWQMSPQLSPFSSVFQSPKLPKWPWF